MIFKPMLKIDPFFRRLAVLLFWAILLYVLFLLRSVLTPFIVAFVFAYMLNPLVSWLNRFIGRGLAIVLVYVFGALVAFGLLVWLLPMLYRQVLLIWDFVPQMVNWYNQTGRMFINRYIGTNLDTLDFNMLSDIFVSYVQSNYQVSDAQTFLKKALSSGLGAVNALGLIVMVPILTFYFLYDWQNRLKTWQQAIPVAYQNKVTQIAKDCDKALMSFAKGQVSVMVLLGLIYAIQLQLIGLNLGLIIGISAGVASFVPYLGFGLGILSALIVGVVQFGLDPLYLGLIIGAFLVGQAMEGYVLQPLLLGDKIGLSALWVIFSVLAGASLFGFIGMLIALPVSAVINVLFRHTYDAYISSDYYLNR